jgi:hypothetical protein
VRQFCHLPRIITRCRSTKYKILIFMLCFFHVCVLRYVWGPYISSVFIMLKYIDYLSLYLNETPLTCNLRTSRLLSFNALSTHLTEYKVFRRLRPLASRMINLPRCAWMTLRMNQKYECHITMDDTSSSMCCLSYNEPSIKVARSS